MVRHDRLRRYDFGTAPMHRHSRSEPNWRSHLRGIIATLSGSPRLSTDAGAFFEDHRRECRGHLDALGLTLADAKALVFPKPEKVAKPLRRTYGLRLKRDAKTAGERASSPCSSPRTPRQAPSPATEAAGDDDPPGPPEPGARLCRPDGLPHVLYADDLARFFGVGTATARRNLVGGRYGDRFRIGRRWALCTVALFEHLKAIEERPRGQRAVPNRVPFKAASRWQQKLASQARRSRKGSK